MNTFGRSIGKIKNIKLFNFSDYLDVNPSSKSVTVYDNLDEIFDPDRLIASQEGLQLAGLYDNISEKVGTGGNKMELSKFKLRQ